MERRNFSDLSRHYKKMCGYIESFENLMSTSDQKFIENSRKEMNKENHFEDPVYQKLDLMKREGLITTHDGRRRYRDFNWALKDRTMEEKLYLALDCFPIERLKVSLNASFLDIVYEHFVETSEK